MSDTEGEPYFQRIMRPALEAARAALVGVLPPSFRFVLVLAHEKEDQPGVVMFSTCSNLCDAGCVNLLAAAWRRIVTTAPDGEMRPLMPPDDKMH